MAVSPTLVTLERILDERLVLIEKPAGKRHHLLGRAELIHEPAVTGILADDRRWCDSQTLSEDLYRAQRHPCPAVLDQADETLEKSSPARSAWVMSRSMRSRRTISP